WSGELVQFGRDGRQILIEGSWTLIRDEHGQPRSVLVINTDVTARKNLEAQVFHSQRLESLGGLAGGLAHDFNNLLVVVGGNVQLAMAQLPPAHPAGQALSEVEVATDRGTGLVRQLLTFSRREAPKRRVIAVEPLVVEALGMLRLSLPPGLRLDPGFAADVP